MTQVFNEILGKEVELPDKPTRIVSFSPALTECLFLLGLGDEVAGVSAFCARPPEARTKRKVGSYSTVSLDLLNEMRPDLILTVTGYQRNFALGLAESFPAYPLELPVSVAGIIDSVVKLGLVTGVPDKAREVASGLATKLSEFRPLPKRLRVYVEIDLGGPVTFGANSYITDALSFFGCTNVYGGTRSEWLKPDPNQVEKMDPDVMFFEAKMFSKFTEADLVDLVESRGWHRLSAVASKNFLLTPGPLDFLAHHGPSFITEVMPWLKQKLTKVSETKARA